MDTAVGKGQKWTDLVQRADENNRRYLRELGITLRALRKLSYDTGQTHLVFDVLENFPTMDVVRWHSNRLPILRAPRFQELWATRSVPDLRNEAVAKLRALPPGTLGHEYAKFVEARKLDNYFLEYMTVDTPAKFLAYRIGHLHDLFHFILGYDPYDPIGEMEIECFLYAQGGAINHLFFLSGFVIFLLRNDPRVLWKGLRRLRTAYEYGKQAENLLLLKWQDYMDQPLAEVRRQLRIDAHPVCKAPPLAEVTPRLAHVVFNVPDVARASMFYQRVYGYQVATEDKALGVVFLTAGDDHHTIALQECLSLNPLRLPASLFRMTRRGLHMARAHLRGETSRLSGRRRVMPPPRIVWASLRNGLNHLGFRAQNEQELRAYYHRLRAAAAPILWTVNHGDMIKGIYFKDPAGNVCEIFADGEKAQEIRAKMARGEVADDMRPDDLPSYELDLESELGAPR